MKTSSFIKIVALGIFLTFSSHALYAAPNQVVLSAEMVNPYLKANRKQKTFLKIGLTGFSITNTEKRAPVNVAIVIDQSSSMSGEKIKQAREAAQMALRHLNKDDVVSVVAYSSSVWIPVPATKANEKGYIESAIEKIQANGSTALFAGVSKGASELRKYLNKKRVNRVILLSDGMANVGPSSPHQLGELGAALAKEGMSVTTIGLGLGYNEDLMAMLAQYSDGNHAFVENAVDLAKVFDLEFGDVLSVVAQDVNIKIRCGDGIQPVRVLGRDAEILGRDVMVSLNQLYGAQEKFIMLEVEVPVAKENQKLDIASVDLTYANMLTHKQDNLQANAFVNFTRSDEEIKKTENREVAIDAVEQLATQRSKDAMRLRDEGKIKEARKVLMKNKAYLQENSSRLNSPKLKSFSEEVEEDAENLEGENWISTRKKMKKSNYQKEAQQSF